MIEFILSNHARQRFAERVLDLDPRAARRLPMSVVLGVIPDHVRIAIAAGCSRISCDGVVYLARQGVVVTVLTDSMRVSRTRYPGRPA